MDDKDNKIQNSDEKVVNNKDETMSKVAAVEQLIYPYNFF